MLFFPHGSHIMEHVLQQEHAPFLFLGTDPAMILSVSLIQEQLTLEGLVSYLL